MKKGNLIAGVLVALLVIAGIGVYFLFFNETSFKESTTAPKAIEEPVKNDKSLSNKKAEEGRFVHTGSPYKFGEVIYVQGVGVEVTKGEVLVNPFKVEGLEKQKYISFNLRILNYNDYPYEISPNEIIFEHERSESETQRQDMSASGYEKWQYFENSFIFGEIKKNMLREGKIYTPVSENALEQGKLTISINNVPLTFKY